MKPWLQKSLIWFGGLTLVGFVILSQTKFTECLSESLEGVRYMLFLKHSFNEHSRPYHGDIVLIQDHQEDHVGELTKWPYSKRVLGLPGDRILRETDGIRVSLQNSKTQPCISKVLPLLKHTSKGKPLTPLSAKVIPEGYVFVAGDNSNSFDSRYEEFGLVPVQKIYGKAWFTW